MDDATAHRMIAHLVTFGTHELRLLPDDAEKIAKRVFETVRSVLVEIEELSSERKAEGAEAYVSTLSLSDARREIADRLARFEPEKTPKGDAKAQR